jgi:hypothetical protein
VRHPTSYQDRLFFLALGVGVLVLLTLWLGMWAGRRQAREELLPPTYTVTIPACEEDEPYLRGAGDFDGQTWERYVCIHIDSIERS